MATQSGANLSISLKDRELLVRLDEVAKGADTKSMMSRFGEYFQKSTQDRFASQAGPDGNPWAPLSPGYLNRKKKNSTLILTLNAYLRRSIRYQVLASDTVAWGTNMEYAAIHQFGGTIAQAPQSRLTRFREVGGSTQFAKKRHTKGVSEKWVERGAYEAQMPARPYLGVSDADNTEALAIVQDWYHRRLNGLPD